jgi:hypothetical protein
MSTDHAVANQRGVSMLSLLLLVFTLAGNGLTLAFIGVGCAVPPTPYYAAELYSVLLSTALSTAFVILGALITHAQPANRIGWLAGFIGLFFMLFTAAGAYATCAMQRALPLPGPNWSAWVAYVTPMIAVLLLFSFLPFWFPDGRFLSKRWRWMALFLLVPTILITMAIALRHGPMVDNGVDGHFMLLNPLGLLPMSNATGALITRGYVVLVILLAFVAIASLVLRWRRAQGETRQQLKWFAYFLVTAVTVQLAIEFYGDVVDDAIFDTPLYLIVITAVMIGFPLVIGIAVLKYRLYDIDIIIRRTLVYGLLTAVLIAVYFGVVIVAQSTFVALTGQESPVAIVISTLVIAALFNPLRQRLQAFIDRRFYRRSYNAALTLERFAQTARDEVDLEQLTAELSKVVQETMKPELLSLWLKTAVDGDSPGGGSV